MDKGHKLIVFLYLFPDGRWGAFARLSPMMTATEKSTVIKNGNEGILKIMRNVICQ